VTAAGTVKNSDLHHLRPYSRVNTFCDPRVNAQVARLLSPPNPDGLLKHRGIGGNWTGEDERRTSGKAGGTKNHNTHH
jgi:hypothetical protein